MIQKLCLKVFAALSMLSGLLFIVSLIGAAIHTFTSTFLPASDFYSAASGILASAGMVCISSLMYLVLLPPRRREIFY